ncbi:MAG: hypothetical protein CMP50_05915 [Flavobacteriales bacterium]|nr:hypothetical protein [Flavobacteriales bacterium]|tara:strand:- start:41 stop:547 length:507 start_codon:yes stop_codon:yes gene_type:complete
MKKRIKKHAFSQGAYLGLFLLLIMNIFYFSNPESIMSGFNTYSILFMLVLLIYPVISIYNFDFSTTESIFKDYFSTSFIMMLTALLITTFYSYLLYNFIDCDLINQYVDLQYDTCLKNPNCNMSFEESLLLYKNDYFSISGQLQSYVFALIPCTLYSAIISLLMKIIK